ncbi:mucin-2 [Antennarius striatus]|uniref:mucin-2 n=1 Tax=Antennarius striatus TaxID=241820 RepID=UPI0035AEF510
MICDWMRNQPTASAKGNVSILESGPLRLEWDACLEFWYLDPVTAGGSELHVQLKSSIGLKEIWASPFFPRNFWKQVFIPISITVPGTKVVFEVASAASTEEGITLNRIGVRRGSCGHQCESNTELWTDERTHCHCSAGQLLCSPSQCPQGQVCASQRESFSGHSAIGTCTIHSNTDCSTFDGVLFRFMVPCTVTLAKTCLSSKALPEFSVEVVNERDGNSSLPAIHQVVVEIGHYRVSLMSRQTRRVVVNGVWKKLPLKLNNDSVMIQSNPAAVLLKTNFGLSVSYDKSGAVHINLPPNYSDQVCGFCGNFNHLSEDDYRKPDGTDAPDATSLAESWQPGQSTSSCETILVPYHCDPMEEDKYASELYCGGLFSIAGPFAECLPVLGAQSYFRGCVVGMCSSHGDPAVLCDTLQAYADVCQEAGVDIPAWRNSEFCPLQCGENSHYNPCADGCPEMCTNLDIVGSCGSCVERCECISGFKLSGGKCVPAGDCGCWSGGKHYEKGEKWIEGDCTETCQCMGDNVVQCNPMQCPKNEVCKVKDGVKDCFPLNITTCSIYGDPHYLTYDGMAYSFQGGCSYTLTTTCGDESTVQFTVIGHNMHPSLQNFTRSKLEAVTLVVGDLRLTMNQTREAYVDDVGIQLPYSKKGPYGTVSVYKNSNYIILEATFGLRMMIDGQNRLFLQVDERFKYELCGLCGTFSEHQDDDFVTPGGQNATGPFEFGDSWRLESNNECIIYPNNPKLCDYAEEDKAYRECNVLLRDVFKTCHEPVHPSIYISSCVYDYCATSGDQQTLCESLKSYVAACQVAGLKLPHWQTDTACADLSTTSAPPTTSTSPTPDQTFCPLNCNFEKNLCGWEQLIQDSFDWTKNSGPTPSNLTGPTKDHTTGAGFYMYIEGDNVTHGDSARLLSSTCHYNGPLCLHFWYHMYGSAKAMALNMYLLKANKATKVWALKNNQGPQWHPGYIDIRVPGPFQIIVEGIRGSNAQSDVAIDDISIHFGSCSAAEVIPSHSVCDFHCNFDNNLCGWNQMLTDAFDWTWQNGSTPTQNTGPSADHTGDGHYLYIEASSVTHGDTARLISSECPDSGPQCLHFWYHMYGSANTMGLNVYLLQNKKADVVWSKRNNQGNVWHLVQVDMTTTGAFQIIIEGRRGSNEESDVSIDDVNLYSERCSDVSVPVTRPPKPDLGTAVPSTVFVPITTASEHPPVNVTAQFLSTTLPPTVEATTSVINGDSNVETSACQLNCNFEKNLCQWSQLLTDVFDWTRLRGSTPTTMTGPSSDHTSGDGHYLYIEANSVTHGDTARLISSECSDFGPQCLQFWYHMYGSADTMGLHVYLLQNRKAVAVWRKRNNQGNMWHLAQVDLTTTEAFKIIFEGRRGSNDRSDVAIDDVSLYHGHCKDLAKPTVLASTSIPGHSTAVTQLQTSIPSETQPTTTTRTTRATTAFNTQVPITSATTLTTETSNPDVPTSGTQATITSGPIRTTTTGPKTTVHPQSPTTVLSTGVETSQQPGTDVTERPQTTRPKQPVTSTNEPPPQTTAGPQPQSTVQTQPLTDTNTKPSTTAGLQPPSTGGLHPSSTAQPQSQTTVQTQPSTKTQAQTTLSPQLSTTAHPSATARPKPPSTAQTQHSTTDRPQPPSTAHMPPSTSARPQHTSTAHTQTSALGTEQPPSTDQPQPTLTGGPHSSSPARTQSSTTAIPKHPSTTYTQTSTSGRPQPPNTAHTQNSTTDRSQPPSTAHMPSSTPARPQHPSTAHTQTSALGTEQPPSTDQPQPTLTGGPHSSSPALTQSSTTAIPEHPSTTYTQTSTSGRPQPPNTAHTQHSTSGRSQPPSTAHMPSSTSDRPQYPSTAHTQTSALGTEQPPSTDQPQPPFTGGPHSSSPARTQSSTTAIPEHPSTTYTQTSTSGRPQPPNTAHTQHSTTDRSQPPSTAHKPSSTSDRPQHTSTAHTQTSASGRPQPPNTAHTQHSTTDRSQPPSTAHMPSSTSDRPQYPSTAHTQTSALGTEQPPSTDQPQPPFTGGPHSSSPARTQSSTTAIPEHPSTTYTQTSTSGRPQPPNTAHTQHSTTDRSQPPSTAHKPSSTSDRPQHTSTAHTQTSALGTEQPPSTDQPQPTLTGGPHSSSPARTQSSTTAIPEHPSTTYTQTSTSGRPQPPNTAHTQHSTTDRSQPPSTAHMPSSTSDRPQHTSTAHTQTSALGTEQPPSTDQPQPPLTGGPHSSSPARTQSSTTAIPEHPSTTYTQTSTSGRPQPPNTAHTQHSTTDRSQPPSTAHMPSSTSDRPQHTSTAHTQTSALGTEQPPITDQPQPPLTGGPHSSSPARTQSSTTAIPEHPSTTYTQTSTSGRPQPPNTAHTQQSTTAKSPSPSTDQPQPPLTGGLHSSSTSHTQFSTTARTVPPRTAQSQTSTSGRPQTPNTAHTQNSTQSSTESQSQTLSTPQSLTTGVTKPSTETRPQPPVTITPHSTTGTRPLSTTPSISQSTTPVSTPPCTQNSHYTTCVPACSPTCTDLNGPPRCNDSNGCVEGCVCNEGFVQKGRFCVPIQQCGCVERNGATHQFNEVWYTDHCIHKCECEEQNGEGKINCDYEEGCVGNAVCLKNEEGDYYCQSTGVNECTVRGHVEYKTFDKMKYDFEGEHSYVLVQTRNLAGILPDIYVEATNTRTLHDDSDSHHGDSRSEEDHSRRVKDDDDDDDDDEEKDNDNDADDDDNDDDSHDDDSHDDDSKEYNYKLKELKIRVHNHTVELKEKRRLVVDGRRTKPPVSPSPGLNIYVRFSRIYLKTDFGLSVEFNGHSSAGIILPRIYRRKVRGLCGNFDSQMQDEWIKPDGTRARSVEEFGDSWRV